MKEADQGATKMTVSQICLYRKGSDIDLEAIFGGNISGKRKNGVKENPVFKTGQGSKKGDNSAIENDMGGIEIQVYDNIPKAALKETENNVRMKDQLTKENSRTERDKVTVTNGDVCVGDIIIENGHRNPAFSLDADIPNDGDVLEHSVQYTGEGEGQENMTGSNWPDLDDIALPLVSADQDLIESQDKSYETIDYNRNNTMFKSEIDPSDINIDICNNPDYETHSVSDNNVENESANLNGEKNENQTVSAVLTNDSSSEKKLKSSEINDVNPEDMKNENDDSALYNKKDVGLNGMCSSKSEQTVVQNMDIPNNDVHQSQNNGLLSSEQNMSDNSNFNESQLIRENSVNEKDKSKKKNKKLKQRKNSLPDHILNSLNMKPSKPILVPVVADDSALPIGRSRSSDCTSEQKTVKFSDDTVFNDQKPNKYKQEKLTLRDIYKGKISSKEAVAKMNPVFVDEDNHGLTDDEKAEKYGQNGLNTPAYLKDYILSHGDEEHSFRQPGLTADNDIESISSEGAVNYDKLIKRTIAKKRRNRIIRVTCATFTFLVVVAVVVVLVIFVGQR